MKNSILSALFILLSFLSFGQGFTIVATAENGKKDTVSFGFKSNASLGVDTALGEKDIFGQPLKEVDVRVVQRDSLNFSCTYTFLRRSADIIDTFKHFFPIKFDSKANFRSRSDTSFINRLFEIRFFTKNVKNLVMTRWQDNNILPYTGKLDTFAFFIDSCLNAGPNLLSALWNPNSSAPAVLTGSNYFFNFTIVFPKRMLTSINDTKATSDIRIFPNPFTDRFIIDNIGNRQIQEVRLFDVLGRQVLVQKVDFSERIEVDVSHLQQGMYCLSLFDKENRLVSSKMLVKAAQKQ